jgi:hypothetical protein
MKLYEGRKPTDRTFYNLIASTMFALISMRRRKTEKQECNIKLLT